VVSPGAAGVPDQQPHFAAHGVLPAGRHVGIGRTGRAALDGSAHVAGEPAKQDRLGVLQVSGRHAKIRRRVHGDQLQQRVVHFARGRVLAADAAAVRIADQMDVANHQPPAPRGRPVPGCSHLQVQLPAGERPSRHPALQFIDQRPQRRLRNRSAGLLQPDLEHRRESVVRDRIAQHQDGREPAVGLRNDESGASRRHFRADLRQSERRGDAEHGQPDEFAVHPPREPERQPWVVCAGQVDVEAVDADLRCPLRLLQRVDPRTVGDGRTIHVARGPGGAGAHRSGLVRAVLEGLDDPRRRVLRSVWHRQDGAQDFDRQVGRSSICK